MNMWLEGGLRGVGVGEESGEGEVYEGMDDEVVGSGGGVKGCDRVVGEGKMGNMVVGGVV